MKQDIVNLGFLVETKTGHIGEVVAVGTHGVRLTLFDFLVGAFCGWDEFVSWADLSGCMIATDEHNHEEFIKMHVRDKTRTPRLWPDPDAIERERLAAIRARREAESAAGKSGVLCQPL